MSDERPHSLAAQAASWVPPWERAQRPPDPAYAASAPEPDISDEFDDLDGAEADAELARSDEPEVAELAASGDPDVAEVDAEIAASDEWDRAAADAGAAREVHDRARRDGPAQDADAEGDSTDGVPAELPPLPGEAQGGATVDAPQELPGEEPYRPTEFGAGPEVPLPPSISDAVEDADPDDAGSPVDAPLPPDGDDAGDVFDAAADDEVDDAEIDLPFAEEVPDTTPDETPDGDGAPGDAAHRPGPDADPAGAAGAEVSAGGGDAPAAPAAPVRGGPPAAVPAAAGRGGAGIPAQGRGGGEPAAAVAGGGSRTEEEAAPPALMDEGEMRAALEAILLVVDEPVAEMQLAQILEQPTERVAAMLEDISARYTAAGHGFDLRRAAGGWRLYTRPEYAAYVERFVLDGQSVRLTQAALETLAVVAYKQPVTRSRISAIRGVNCDGVMRTLVTRGLVEECGTESETGAYLYRTTGLFLEKLGLNSVDQLPPLAPFLPDDVEEVLDASG